MLVKFTTLVTTATLLTLISTCPHAAGDLCRFESDQYASLIRDKNAKCIALRTNKNTTRESLLVWELTPTTRFATQCPVASIKLDVHSGTACSNVAAFALKEGDSVRVDPWTKDQLHLTIQRRNRSVFHYTQGPVLLDPVEVMLDKVRTIGYRADNVMVYAESPTDPPLSVSYYVYLSIKSQLDPDTKVAKYIRWYTVEVFNSDAACRDEIPGTRSAETQTVTCPAPGDVDLNSPASSVSAKALQFPSGGGGEVPPG